MDCEIDKSGGKVSLKGKGFSVVCDKKLESVIEANNVSEGLVFGMRPQDITIEREASKGLIQGEIYVFEPLGGEAVATVKVDEKLVKIVCPWEDKFSIEEKVGLNFSIENIHLFERQSGAALYT